MIWESVRDEARRAVVARGLTPAAVAHLTHDALGTVDLSVLAPVKGLLKRFFSDQPWTTDDDRSLADLVGAGEGWWQHDLDKDYRIGFGWRDDVFRLEVAPRRTLGETFAGPVVPEATPNPRTIRFVTPPIHDGPSRWYESAAGVDDPRIARLFAEFDDVANVLVGPDFVAVGLQRPDRWEELLNPILQAVTDEFASPAADAGHAVTTDPEPRGAPFASHSASAPDHEGAVERAWKELGSLRPDAPGDLDRILAGVSSPSRAVRQVTARLLVGAEHEAAASAWERLLADPSRSVRRATVDAIVDAERPALRPLLERALQDADAWTRWKALRGLADLGIEPSRAAVVALAHDPDFRVRLETARALAGDDVSIDKTSK